MSILTIVDLETTGFNPQIDHIIEIAGIQYSIEHKTVLKQFSTLLPCSHNNAEHVNGISAEASNIVSHNTDLFQVMLCESDYLVGHNLKGFDIKFLSHYGYISADYPMLDTMIDFIFPKSKPKSKRLIDIAIDHGIPVYKPHRALYDCQLIVDILDCYSVAELQSLIAAATEPRSLYVSLEPVPGTLSKEAGFTFNKDVPRKWSRHCTEAEIKQYSFRCAKVS